MKIINCNDEASSYLVWKPGANTVAYYPLDSVSAFYDKTGHGNTLTNYNVVIGTYNGVNCAYFNGSARLESNISGRTTVNHTLAAWCKRNGGDIAGIICANPCGIFAGDVIYPSGDNKYVYQSYKSGGGFSIESNTLNQSEWHCIIFTGGKLYIDGVLHGSGSGTYQGGYTYTIGGHTKNSSCTRKFLTGYIGDVVIDDSSWTEEQVLDFYQKTKKRYGL